MTVRAPDGWYQSPIHATLLPDGRVFVIGVARATWPADSTSAFRRASWVFTPSAPGDPLPAEISPADVAQPVEIDRLPWNGVTVNDDLFCAGTTLTGDGRVFIAGGTRAFLGADGQPVVVLGLPYQTMFDPATATISRIPGYMQVSGATGTPGRWYPTTTRLPNGRILVLGGFDRVIGGPTYNFSAESFDPVTGQRAVLAPFGAIPGQIGSSDYPHTWVLPYAGARRDLLVLGEAGVPVTTATSSFLAYDTSAPPRPGTAGVEEPGFGQSSVMLPIRVKNGEWGYRNGSIVVTGGAMHTPLMRQVDVYDPLARTWKASIDTGTSRHHGGTVVLPDGRVLIVAGHDMDGDTGVLRAQYVDPANGFSVTNGETAMAQVRGYHSVTLLLPDGRVLVGGGRDVATGESVEKPSFQYYSPDYMSKPRPGIVGVATQIGYRQTFPIVTAGPAPKEAMLVALGSMTHSFDANQRVVQLPVGAVVPGANGTRVMVASGPADAWVAPPGHYMLFVLDANRVPSVAKIVRIG